MVLFGKFQMVAHKVARKDYITINLQYIFSCNPGNGLVLDNSLAESVILLSNVNDGHGTLFLQTFDELSCLFARAVISNDYLIGQDGLSQHALYGLLQGFGPVVC